MATEKEKIIEQFRDILSEFEVMLDDESVISFVSAHQKNSEKLSALVDRLEDNCDIIVKDEVE